ncbi:MAG: hypothetical protein ACK4UO_06035 [Pseudolabrys sp.]
MSTLMARLSGLLDRVLRRPQRSIDAPGDGTDRPDELGRFLALCCQVPRGKGPQLGYGAAGRRSVDARESSGEIGQPQGQHVGNPPVGDESGFKVGAGELSQVLRGWQRRHGIDPSLLDDTILACGPQAGQATPEERS